MSLARLLIGLGYGASHLAANLRRAYHAESVITTNKLCLYSVSDHKFTIDAPYGFKQGSTPPLQEFVRVDINRHHPAAMAAWGKVQIPSPIIDELSTLCHLYDDSEIGTIWFGNPNDRFANKFKRFSQQWIDGEVATGTYGITTYDRPTRVRMFDDLPMADQKYVVYYTNIFRLFVEINKLNKAIDNVQYTPISSLYNNLPNIAGNISDYDFVAFSFHHHRLCIHMPGGAFEFEHPVSDAVFEQIKTLYQIRKSGDYYCMETGLHSVFPGRKKHIWEELELLNIDHTYLNAMKTRWKRLRPLILSMV